MTEPPPEAMFGSWMESSETDDQGATVYRPEGYDLPKRRGGGGGIELHPDGTVVAWEVGPDDAPRPVKGVWIREGPRRLRLTFPETGRPDRVVEVVEADNEVLRLRQAEPGGAGPATDARG
jgi:hypothetical protein